MPVGTAFADHVHAEHQLAWAARGVVRVRTGEAGWVLPPTRALFIPAGVAHETSCSQAATMRSTYLPPDSCPLRFAEPVPVAVTPMLAELIGFLEHHPGPPQARARAEAVLHDLIVPAELPAIAIRLPRDPRAREVAVALAADPTDRRTLAQWGHEVGASSRTLARGFVAGTGVGFRRWRTLARVHLALELLAEGTSSTRTAQLCGYDTASAFVAAFRRETGTTPGRCFAVT